MRILRVAQKVYPEIVGGGPYHVHALSRDQAAMGHDVTVLALSMDSNLPRREQRSGYTLVRRTPTTEILGNGLSAGIARYLRQASGYDVVHAHSHLYFSTNFAALERRLGSTPLAITNHGLYSQSVPEWVFRWYLRTLGRLTLDSADIVFCYTEEDAARLREFGVQTNIAVVPNGIDTNRFQPDGPTNDLLDTDKLTALFVGRLVEGKRPGDALVAVEKVRESHPEVQLAIVGDGPLKEDLEQTVAERGLNETVEFLGEVPYEEMPELYRAADLFILPSRAEGLPRTVLEAMATETPVVASDLPQLGPIIDGAGISVPVGDINGFAAALEELAADSDKRVRYGARGHERVADEFAWNDTTRITTDHLESFNRGQVE